MDARQLAPLLGRLRRLGKAGTSALRREYDALANADNSSAPPPDGIAPFVQEFGGAANEAGGVILQAPLDRLDEVANELLAANQTLTSLRVFDLRGQPHFALTWNTGSAKCQWKTELGADELRSLVDSLANDGLFLVDLDVREVSGSLRFAGLWRKAGNSDQAPQVFVDTPYAEDVERQNNLSGFTLDRFVTYRIDGQIRCSSIWRCDPAAEKQMSFARSRAAGAFGDLEPGYLQTDCRLKTLAPEVPPSMVLLRILDRYSDQGAASRLRRARALNGLGRFQEAHDLAVELLNESESPTYLFLRAEALAKLGEAEELGKAIKRFSETKAGSVALDSLLVRKAVLENAREAARPLVCLGAWFFVFFVVGTKGSSAQEKTDRLSSEGGPLGFQFCRRGIDDEVA